MCWKRIITVSQIVMFCQMVSMSIPSTGDLSLVRGICIQIVIHGFTKKITVAVTMKHLLFSRTLFPRKFPKSQRRNNKILKCCPWRLNALCVFKCHRSWQMWGLERILHPFLFSFLLNSSKLTVCQTQQVWKLIFIALFPLLLGKVAFWVMSLVTVLNLCYFVGGSTFGP